MDWCSVYLTPQALPKYIYLSPPLIFPTTSNGIRTKNRQVWITPCAAPLRWMGPNYNPHWSTIGLRVTLSYLTKGVIRSLISKNRQHNGQNDKQGSTKHTYKTKDWVTRTALKTGSELRYSGRVGSSCSTNDTRRVILVTNPVISHEREKDREILNEMMVISTLY